ncbi:RNA-binding protein CP33, chloroplastic [Euphorbia lathyris]|uniref:RNA-binding protein CP33, chloroplastic n=1 Tax=Euphorbia lathyris TaxID=212925 RepID=UPI003314290F
MSALSMAASTISSSPLHTKLSNLTFSPSPLPLPTQFSQKPYKPFKFLKLNTHFPNPYFPQFSSDFHLACTAFESFESAEDDNVTSEDDLESETEETEDDGEEEEEEKPSGSNGEGRLYVGNLPYSMTSSQLTEIFQEAGRVASVEVIYDRVTDRSRGFGFVTMASIEEAKEAIQMFNGSLIGGRTARVNFPEVPKGGEREVMGTRMQSTYKGFVDSPHKLYAGNLGWTLTSQALRDAFADQPGLLSVKVIYERDTGRSRGFGFITFETAEAAEAALESMNGVEVEGRPLRLNLAADRARPVAYQRANAEDNLESTELFSGIGS